ncbi:hypothetical protein K9O30_10455 [Clostridium bowmanii]|uniref:hypothetical protein n=1 Tax=Clostridium bowmanii TaxID=132925 RepID=UPI001C0B95DE|nr:hypothetical protein [Clostridium bowmanii]MBU3189519.1 hypothetical protein [Clostridium bowmanii]MCA1074134.1 hypothetical protein [Clostridium bowmanii]
MKVTKREQMLIGTLLIVLLGYCFYKFFYIPQNQKIVQLKVSRDTYSQKWEQVKAKIASKSEKNEQYKILNAKIFSKTDMLFPSIQQEEIIVVLDKMIKESKLQAEVLGFSEVSSNNTEEDKSKTNTATNEKITINELDKLVNDFNSTLNKEAITEKTNTTKVETNTATTKTVNTKLVGAYTMQVTLEFKGIYEELISFIKQVENYDKKIIINNINIVAAEGNIVSGNVIVQFYGVPKLINNDDFKWDYKVPSGKENPFEGAVTSVNVTTKKKVEVKNDFVMSAKPITSDLPTIRIGKAEDNSTSSYVYADNIGVEAVEFHFSKKGDKYYYKYKTSIEAYPKDFNSVNEFVLSSENINLEIFSQKRGGETDLAGANIKIFNDTDKTVVVNVQNDDTVKPRVNILKEKGNVLVNR